MATNEEIETIEDLEKYVLENHDCFERKRIEDAKHIAASVLLLTSDLNKALFLWHTKIKRWTQPGGHADGDCDIHAVALKELEEETGIKGAKIMMNSPIDIYRFDYPAEVYGYKKSIYNLSFIALLPDGQTPQIMKPTKCEKLRWVSPDEALNIIKEVNHEGTERLVKKWQNLISNKKGLA